MTPTFPLRMLSLCSGIGGADVAAESTGCIQVVGQVEIDPFCQQVLAKHWPQVKRLTDIKEVSGDEFGAIDIVAGGIPCQPFSKAGKRRGVTDDRHLWPYAFAIIQKTQPSWVIIENVRNFVSMALDLVLADLESENYEATTFVLPASAIGAPHERERCFVVAHTGLQRWTECLVTSSLRVQRQCARSIKTSGTSWMSQPRMGRVPDGFSTWLHRHQWPALPNEQQKPGEPARTINKNEKVPHRNQRIKALGNAIVPQQIYPLFEAIVALEAEMRGAA